MILQASLFWKVNQILLSLSPPTWEVIGLQGQCDLGGIILAFYSAKISRAYLKEQRTTEDTNTADQPLKVVISPETLAWITKDLKGFCPEVKARYRRTVPTLLSRHDFAQFNFKGWINGSFLMASGNILLFEKVFLFLYPHRQKKKEMIWRESSWIIKEFSSTCCQHMLHSTFLCLIQEIW